ncbi:hypothetical protein [Paraconexibacter sp.]|uniref:hypothetical protein n=1 Tax=Paraconexibacter sp. TaxID=2949640 RepID=UPI0035695EA1
MTTVQTMGWHDAERDGRVWIFVGLGAVLVIAGGLVAAVNSAAPFAHGSWLAAYLVLVGGVAQVGLGAGRLAVAAPVPSARLWRLQVVGWNAGNAAVIVGVLADSTVTVVAGSAPLLIALGAFVVGAQASWARARARALAYDAFALMLAISVVIGCFLSDPAS